MPKPPPFRMKHWSSLSTALLACANACQPPTNEADAYRCHDQDQFAHELILAARARDASPTDKAVERAFFRAAGTVIGHNQKHGHTPDLRVAGQVKPTIVSLLSTDDSCVDQRALGEVAGGLGLGDMAIDVFMGAARSCMDAQAVAEIKGFIVRDSEPCPAIFELSKEVWSKASKPDRTELLDEIQNCSHNKDGLNDDATFATNVSFVPSEDLRAYRATRAARQAANDRRRADADLRNRCHDGCLELYGSGTGPSCQSTCGGTAACARMCEERGRVCDEQCGPLDGP